MRPRQGRRVRFRRTSTLIITEGSQTEPNYFDALARDRSLTSLIIPRNHVTDPVSLVRQGREALRRDRSIERAYIVFDTFEHQNYRDALGLCDNYAQSGVNIKAVPSYPSFEYWLLLHFEYTRAPMSREDALHRLRAKLPNYEKSSLECMDVIISEVDRALCNGLRVKAEVNKTGDLNPSTHVRDMVKDLIDLDVE